MSGSPFAGEKLFSQPVVHEVALAALAVVHLDVAAGGEDVGQRVLEVVGALLLVATPLLDADERRVAQGRQGLRAHGLHEALDERRVPCRCLERRSPPG